MKLYVGNLPYTVDDTNLREIFEAHAEVDDAFVLRFRESGRSRGFGFVTISDDEQAQKAIAAMDGTEVGGRTLKVNEARPKVETRSPFSGWRGNGSGRGQGGHGGGRRGNRDRDRW